jgi:outer membrane protein OmpA-like peptidoglycan-associated protein
MTLFHTIHRVATLDRHLRPGRGPRHSRVLPGLTALSAALVLSAGLAGCASTPMRNEPLEQARSALSSAQANAQTRELAPVELSQAASALAVVDAAVLQSASPADVNHLAYLTTQRVALAQEAALRKAAEAEVARNTAAQDRFRLAARTKEADAAQARAVEAQGQVRTAQQQTANAQAQAGDARERNRQLESQLSALNAKQTPRGMVITIGDVLFDTDRAELKPGGKRGMDQLAGFLTEYPQRRALIEGYTDSRGSESHNQALAGRRAESVRGVLEEMGIAATRLDVQALGESFPVAGNDSASGRQANRRVEILLSDETGRITPR